MSGEGRAARERGPRGAGATRLALIVSVAWLVVSLALLPAYGPTWDAVQFDAPLGEALLHAITSDDVSLHDALETKEPGPARAPHPRFKMTAPWWFAWPLTATLSAISCRVFWTGLGWLDAVPAHHLPDVLFTALLLFVMVRWCAARLGTGGALAAAVLLMTAPRFLADSFNNPKDGPEACLYVLAWLATARAFERGTLRAWLAVGALVGAALAQKVNAVFLVPQAVVLLLCCMVFRVRIEGDARRLLRNVAAAALVAGIVLFACSPTLWPDPLGNLRRQIDFVVSVNDIHDRIDEARAAGEVVPPPWRLDAPAHALWTTPIPMLLLAPLGLFCRRLSKRDRLVLAIGAVFPVMKMPFLGVPNYDGVRHFLEFLPPLALLAAAGMTELLDRGSQIAFVSDRPAVARGVRLTVALLLLVPGAWAAVRTHPNGVAYYNALVGGLRGAQQRRIESATDYWANSYWQAAAWLRDHAERDAMILVPIVPKVMQAIAPVRLRDDLKVPTFRKREPQGVVYVVYVTRTNFYTDLVRRLERESTPVHEILCDGAPILRIHRLDGDARSRAFKEWQRDVLAHTATPVSLPDDDR